jgi:hypothetical protein
MRLQYFSTFSVLYSQRGVGPASAPIDIILTRRAEAPQALDDMLVARLFDALVAELVLRVRARDFKQRFTNTLSALFGLFRWRVVRPWSLLVARDTVAAEARATVEHALEQLERLGLAVRQGEQKAERLRALLDFLDGRGDPDILVLLEADALEVEEYENSDSVGQNSD